MKNPGNLIFNIFPFLKPWLAMPAFTGWLSFSSGIVIAKTVPLARHVLQLYDSLPSAAIIICFSGALLFRNRALQLLFLCIAGIASFHYATDNANTCFQKIETHISGTTVQTISGTVISPPLDYRRYYSFYVAADTLAAEDATILLNHAVFQCFADTQPPAYGRIRCSGKIRLPTRNINPHAYNEYATAIANGVTGRFQVSEILCSAPSGSYYSLLMLSIRKIVLKAIAHTDDLDHIGILEATFLNEKENLTPQMNSLFVNSGIYHLLSISGFHVVVLIASVLFVLSFIPLPRTVKIFIAIGIIWWYQLFIGFIPSLFRAVIMGTLVLLSVIVQRNNRSLNTLGVAGIIWLVLSPHSLFTAGFQLSFAATFAIITVLPRCNYEIIFSEHGKWYSLILKPVVDSFIISVACFAATAPILIYYFGSLSPYGLLANIPAVIIMSIVMNISLAGFVAQMLWAPLAGVIMHIADFFLSILIAIARFSLHIPYASLHLPVPYGELIILYCLALTGFVVINKKFIRTYGKWIAVLFFCTIPAFVLIHNLHSGTEVVFFTTKTGSCTGIRFPNNKIWIVNSSPETSFNHPYKFFIEPWLRHQMIKKIDAIVLPAVSQNSIHDLEPVVSNAAFHRVILGNTIADTILSENLELFLKEFNAARIPVQNCLSFIPASQCTCTIYATQTNQPWFEDAVPAPIRLSIQRTRIFLNCKPLPDLHDTKSILVNGNACIFLSTVPAALYARDAYDKSAQRVTLKSDGAVVVTIDKSGTIKRIKQL